MAGKFTVSTSFSASVDALYKIYDFIVNSGQTVLRLVNDTGSAVALYKQGTGFVSSWASSADCPSGSYLVVEPVAANGSVRWQAKFLLSTNSLTVTLSPTGTWTNAGAVFSATCQTAATQWNDNAAPAAGSVLYCGANTVSYGSSQTYTYFWVNLRDAGSATPDQFCYVGGYTPFNPATDTKPCCLLTRVPQLVDTDTYVGRAGTGVGALTRGPVEYAQTSSWVSAGYARLGLIDAIGPGNPGNTVPIRNLGTEYIGITCYLMSNAGSAWHGHFGDHLLVVDHGRTDYDTNTAATYIVIGHLFLYFNTAL